MTAPEGTPTTPAVTGADDQVLVTSPAPATPAAPAPTADIERLTRERDEAQRELAQLREQAAAKEQNMADEQTTQTAEQLATATRERDEARQEAAVLKLERELSGKVVDPEGAVKLLGTGYRKEDGTLDVDGFLEKHPYMRPQATATAPSGGGDVQAGTSKDAEIEAVTKQLDAAQKAGNRTLAVSLQSRLTQLRQQ